jgi:hypothetical protein
LVPVVQKAGDGAFQLNLTARITVGKGLEKGDKLDVAVLPIAAPADLAAGYLQRCH